MRCASRSRKGTKKASPEEIRLCLWAVAGVAAGQSLTEEAACKVVGISPQTFRNRRNKNPNDWKAACKATGYQSHGKKGPRPGARDETEANMLIGAILVALGGGITKVSRAMGLGQTGLNTYACRHEPEWTDACSRAEKAVELAYSLGVVEEIDEPEEPHWRGTGERAPWEVWQKMLHVAETIANEWVSRDEAARRAGLNHHSFTNWAYTYPRTWDKACEAHGIGGETWKDKDAPVLVMRAKMRTAAAIFVSGHTLSEAGRRMDMDNATLNYYKSDYNKFWKRLVTAERKRLRVPDELYQVARLVEGSDLRKRCKKGLGGERPEMRRKWRGKPFVRESGNGQAAPASTAEGPEERRGKVSAEEISAEVYRLAKEAVEDGSETPWVDGLRRYNEKPLDGKRMSGKNARDRFRKRAQGYSKRNQLPAFWAK
ncbi:MAG: hypothetical protein JXB62_13695 [Pirellulales bacterium]|nr:hypothetical protein [Pirellulales bacterium]